MAMATDFRDCFDIEAHSDIIVKSGCLQFRCHKIVLFATSKYFQKLLDDSPDRRFAEGNQKIIELKDDTPEAVKAMLQYIYRFEYEVVVKKAKDNRDDKDNTYAVFHLHVYVVAQKYLLPELAKKAFKALNEAIDALDAETNAEEVFELAKLLSEHHDHHDTFLDQSNSLVSQYLPKLMELKAFRTWLEEDDNSALDIVLGSLKDNRVESKETQHMVVVCCHCEATFIDSTLASHVCHGAVSWHQAPDCVVKAFTHKDGKLYMGYI